MVGQSLSHYEIQEELGRGGMGIVYKAEDTKLDRTVAIKVLPRDMTRDHVAKTRFVHEAKAASALDHANICTIYSIDETEDGQLYIVMAFYDGRSMQELIDDGPLSIESAINYAVQLGDGLSKAHTNGIIHRDIKPANLMITIDEEVKIVDFGLAKVADHTQVTQEGSTLGTAAYMSPEQARGEIIDERTDQWSMGTVVYEMLSGEKAFRGEYSQAIIYSLLNEEPDSLRKLNPEVSGELASVVERMLKKKPEDRFASVGEASARLKNLLNRERGLESGTVGVGSAMRKMLSPRISIPAISILLVALIGAWMYLNRQQQAEWAREEILPQIDELLESTWSDFTEVYLLAEQAEEYIPNDSRLADAFDISARYINIRTEPEGAEVYVKAYANPDNPWQFLGTTPIENVRVPIGIFRWKIEKEGFESVSAASTTWDLDPFGDDLIVGSDFSRVLDPEGSLPDGMVRIPGFERPDGLVVEDFFIDRMEVTNGAFKEFIEAGAYRNREFWEHEFVRDGEVLSWEDAMREFVDQTGRPGPASWQAGDFLDGQENFPVSGVSWYESAAYAVWAGKQLPTGTHWGRARGEYTPLIQWPQLSGFATFAPFSNFGSDGPVETGSLPGITSFGAFDMAGNVREWCLNSTELGRLIRGAGWSDNTYRFSEPSQAPEFDRSVRNGFRLAVYPGGDELSKDILQPTVLLAPPDFSSMEIVPDEIFEVYRQQFLYDETPLDDSVESVSSSDKWTLERVSYDAAYGDERIIANLFLPTNVEPPYQTVIYFPGSASLFQSSSENIEDYYEFTSFLSFLARNGRAVLFPVYKGTFERQDLSLVPLMKGQDTHAYTEFVTHLVKDFKRSLDYLETREDIDSERLAYYGMSWGGILGAIIPAVEERIKASILLPPIIHDKGRPEVNQINYVTRVTVPTLMLAGEYDTDQQPETAIIPMYELLGTPDEHKELKFYPTDHIPPMNEVIRETLAWLDLYLGPVR